MLALELKVAGRKKLGLEFELLRPVQLVLVLVFGLEHQVCFASVLLSALGWVQLSWQ